MIRISSRDVGLTQVATIWVGEHRAIEFYTHTRHKDYSIEIAESLLAKAIHGLLKDDVKLWMGEPGGDHYGGWYDDGER